MHSKTSRSQLQKGDMYYIVVFYVNTLLDYPFLFLHI